MKKFRQEAVSGHVPDINVGNISVKVPQLSLFNFKALLNMAMLLAESENAKTVRQAMLDPDNWHIDDDKIEQL